MFDATEHAWHIRDLMKELKWETEARKKVGDNKRRTYRAFKKSMKGLVITGRVFFLYCQQIHYSDKCTVVTDISAKILQCHSRCFACTEKKNTIQKVARIRKIVFIVKVGST